jgi:hypothetical protein
MPTVYLGFNIADSMFDGPCTLKREPLTESQFKDLISRGVTSCLNKSHPATVKALKTRYGIEAEIPHIPPRINIFPGDSILIVSLRGLPRHTTSYQYTDAEVAQARFVFARYTRLE